MIQYLAETYARLHGNGSHFLPFFEFFKFWKIQVLATISFLVIHIIASFNLILQKNPKTPLENRKCHPELLGGCFQDNLKIDIFQQN